MHRFKANIQKILNNLYPKYAFVEKDNFVTIRDINNFILDVEKRFDENPDDTKKYLETMYERGLSVIDFLKVHSLYKNNLNKGLEERKSLLAAIERTNKLLEKILREN